MKNLFLTATLLTFSEVALAHEGHGVSMQSLYHYVSGPHLFGSLALGALALVVGYISFRRRNPR